MPKKIAIDWDEVESNWLPYVSVSDVAATAKKAESLGAKQLIRDERLAVLLDPTGAAFGIQQAVEGEQ